MSAPETVHRHANYYFQNGSHIFRVENMLYKLHDDHLSLHSTLFKDMFSISLHVPVAEGKTDGHPIMLEGEKAATFELFLDHAHGYAGAATSYTQDELKNLLEFTDKFGCVRTRAFVIEHIWRSRFSYHYAELVQLGCQFSIPKLFSFGFKNLLGTPLKQINKQHRLQMGVDAFTSLVYAKAVLEEHTRLVACEEPVLLKHAPDCQDPAGCQEDWHNVWWNGMGRFLLDGRNPQPFSDALERFREMKFGRMGTGCIESMFKLLRNGNGPGFKHAETFIDELCEGLVDEFHLSLDATS